MGWLFGYGQKKAELIRSRTKPHEWDGKDGARIKDTVIAHCFRGGRFSGVFYAVHERATTIKDKTETERWLEVTLMECRPMEGHGPSWGYKDMEESMGPGVTSCPLSYFDMVPEPVCPPDCAQCKKDSCSRQYARNFRAGCRARAAEGAAVRAKIKALTKGQIVTLKEGCSPRELVIVSTKPLIGESGGRPYRIKARHLA